MFSSLLKCSSTLEYYPSFGKKFQYFGRKFRSRGPTPLLRYVPELMNMVFLNEFYTPKVRDRKYKLSSVRGPVTQYTCVYVMIPVKTTTRGTEVWDLGVSVLCRSLGELNL